MLTAREARQADQGGGAQVTITGNTFEVRQERRHRRHCGRRSTGGPGWHRWEGCGSAAADYLPGGGRRRGAGTPVTPAGYQWAHEAAIETGDGGPTGDPNFLAGKGWGAPPCTTASCPPRRTRFVAGGGHQPLALHLEQLERWVDKGTVVRWMVSGTPVNAAVLLEG